MHGHYLGVETMMYTYFTHTCTWTNKRGLWYAFVSNLHTGTLAYTHMKVQTFKHTINAHGYMHTHTYTTYIRTYALAHIYT